MIDHLVLRCNDDEEDSSQIVTITDPDTPCPEINDVVEVSGEVRADLSIRADSVILFGESFDLSSYCAMLQLSANPTLASLFR